MVESVLVMLRGVKGIKVICISFRFAAVERQTIKRKTLKFGSTLGWLLPAPRESIEISPRQRRMGTYPLISRASRNLLGVLNFAVR